jgi:phospholipid/cholesterol/gamma-HCH transport system substrate-binding protein
VIRRLRGTVPLLMVTALLGVSSCQFDGLSSLPLPGGAGTSGRTYHVTAVFDDVLDLVPQSAVRVNDVAVGSVERIRLTGYQARVTMRLERTVVLPANAVADIRQTSLLGEKYVSLGPPDGAGPAGRRSRHPRQPHQPQCGGRGGLLGARRAAERRRRGAAADDQRRAV